MRLTKDSLMTRMTPPSDDAHGRFDYTMNHKAAVIHSAKNKGRMTMMSDEENIEVIPLTAKLSLASSQFSAPGSGNLTRSVSSIMTEDSSSSEGLRLAKQAAAALLLALTGWYYPRYLIANEDGIEHKIVPFQKTAAGDVILDFLLNEPLIDPPTIPCKCHIILFLKSKSTPQIKTSFFICS
jgi:hypothetical protein